jgi:hypothetical protein
MAAFTAFTVNRVLGVRFRRSFLCHEQSNWNGLVQRQAVCVSKGKIVPEEDIASLLACWLRLREFPRSDQNLPAWAIHAHGIVPTLRTRQTVRDFPIASAELDCNRAVDVLRRRDVVERISIEIVFLEVAVGVVDADRPGAVNRNVLHVQLVDGGAVVLLWRDRQIESCALGIAAPASAAPDRPRCAARTCAWRRYRMVKITIGLLAPPTLGLVHK